MLMDDRGRNSLELVVAGWLLKLGYGWVLEVAEHHGARLDQATITFGNEPLATATRNREQMNYENGKFEMLPMESSNENSSKIGSTVKDPIVRRLTQLFISLRDSSLSTMIQR